MSIDTVRSTPDIRESPRRARLALVKGGAARLAASSRGKIAMTDTDRLDQVATSAFVLGFGSPADPGAFRIRQDCQTMGRRSQ